MQITSMNFSWPLTEWLTEWKRLCVRRFEWIMQQLHDCFYTDVWRGLWEPIRLFFCMNNDTDTDPYI